MLINNHSSSYHCCCSVRCIDTTLDVGETFSTNMLIFFLSHEQYRDVVECLRNRFQVERDRRSKEASDAVRRQIAEALKEKEDLVKVHRKACKVALRWLVVDTLTIVSDFQLVHLVL